MHHFVRNKFASFLLVFILFASFFKAYGGGGFGGGDEISNVKNRKDVVGFSGTVYLIAIGIDEYHVKGLMQLQFCKSDATHFIERIKKDSSFANVLVFPLMDKEATKPKIKQTFEYISERAKPEDLFIFYDASFGWQGSIILGDSSTISATEFHNWSQAILTNRQLYFLDICAGDEFTGQIKRNLMSNPYLSLLCKQDRIILSVAGAAKEGKELGGGAFTMSYVKNKTAKILDVFSGSNRVKTEFLYGLYNSDPVISKEGDLELEYFSERDFYNSIKAQNNTRGGEIIPDSTESGVKKKLVRKGETLCLTIGIKDYEHTRVLKNTLNDARELTKVLTDKYRTTVIPMENPTYIELMKKLTLIQNDYEFEEGSQFVFFAAAHGGRNQLSEGCLLLKDYQVDQGVVLNAIPLTSIKRVVGQLKCTNSLILLDICHSGTILDEEVCVSPIASEIPKTNKLYTETLSKESVAFEKYLNQKTKLFFGSSSKDEEASDGSGNHSPFASVVLEFLNENKLPVMDTYYLKQTISNKIVKAGAISTPQFCMYGGCKDDGRFLFFLK